MLGHNRPLIQYQIISKNQKKFSLQRGLKIIIQDIDSFGTSTIEAISHFLSWILNRILTDKTH